MVVCACIIVRLKFDLSRCSNKNWLLIWKWRTMMIDSFLLFQRPAKCSVRILKNTNNEKQQIVETFIIQIIIIYVERSIRVVEWCSFIEFCFFWKARIQLNHSIGSKHTLQSVKYTNLLIYVGNDARN